MSKRKNLNKVSSPDELNSYLESTNPFTWVALSLVIVCLAGIFVWSFLAKITYKIRGTAEITSGAVTLNINEKRLSELAVGQKVYISTEVGEITEIKEDGYPVISNFSLDDGNYEYYIVTKTIRPVDYFTRR